MGSGNFASRGLEPPSANHGDSPRPAVTRAPGSAPTDREPVV